MFSHFSKWICWKYICTQITMWKIFSFFPCVVRVWYEIEKLWTRRIEYGNLFKIMLSLPCTSSTMFNALSVKKNRRHFLISFDFWCTRSQRKKDRFKMWMALLRPPPTKWDEGGGGVGNATINTIRTQREKRRNRKWRKYRSLFSPKRLLLLYQFRHCFESGN